MKVRLTATSIEFNDEALEAINLKITGESGKASRETVDKFIEMGTTQFLDAALCVFYMERARKLGEEAEQMLLKAQERDEPTPETVDASAEGS